MYLFVLRVQYDSVHTKDSTAGGVTLPSSLLKMWILRTPRWQCAFLDDWLVSERIRSKFALQRRLARVVETWVCVCVRAFACPRVCVFWYRV